MGLVRRLNSLMTQGLWQIMGQGLTPCLYYLKLPLLGSVKER